MKVNTLKKVKSIVAVGSLILLIACNTSNSHNDDDDVNDTASSINQWLPKSGSISIKDGQLNAIYEHYNKLTTALIEGKAGEAKLESNAIEAGAHKLKDGSSLARAAETITSASDLDTERSAYAKLSTELINMVKKVGIVNGSLYVDFCPMAFNDKGASWISQSKEIKNPYLGPGMISCGQVKETISQD